MSFKMSSKGEKAFPSCHFTQRCLEQRDAEQRRHKAVSGCHSEREGEAGDVPELLYPD